MAQKIELITGEDRSQLMTTNRFYCFGVTPTGCEVSLRNIVSCHRDWTTQSRADVSTIRRLVNTYSVTNPITIKLIIMQSSYGKNRINIHLFINLDESKAKLSIEGFTGFGKFIGRGEIDYEKSNIKADRLKEELNIVVIEPPIIHTGIGKSTNTKRKIIF